ncbi:hypothetical protein [Streptomyces werraensis]|uniref:hypothetical protein n=1 Tax=Streptomyces werraensis TaxID=68284 RepID=UPI0037D0864E
MNITTGVPAVDTALLWGAVTSVLVGGTTALWRAVRAATHLSRRTSQFLDDWYGEPPRPGVPARPGVMERMAGMEERLGHVWHEVYPNNGGSLRDAVDLANERLERLCPDEPGPAPCPPPEPPAPPDGPSGS